MKNINEILFGDKTKQNEKASKEIFQVEEYEGSFWLIHNGALVCPMDMFKGDPIGTLLEIRKLYVERNSHKNGTEGD